MTRIDDTFAKLKAENRAGFISFMMAGDPNYETSLALLKAMPGAGADIIELGICFTDPMADGPAIQAAGLRALAAGQTLRKTLQMVRDFRLENTETPIILMGYYNPIYIYGVETFLKDALETGVDGLIVVDLPPEEDAELCLPARATGMDFIRLATPTTDAARLPEVIKNTSGFVYYVSVAGITGAGTGAAQDVSTAVANLRSAANLPIGVGFGIRTPEKAAEIAQTADAVVVGSAIIERFAQNINASEGLQQKAVDIAITYTQELADATHNAR